MNRESASKVPFDATPGQSKATKRSVNARSLRVDETRQSLPLNIPDSGIDSQKRQEEETGGSGALLNSMRASLIREDKILPLQSHECIIDGVPVRLITDGTESKKIRKQIDS